MKQTLILGLGLACLVAWVGQADAFGRRRGCNDCYNPCPTYTVKYETREVTCYKTVWKKKKVVQKCKKLVCDVKWVDHEYTEYVQKWRDVEREVTCYKHVPYTYYRTVTYCHYPCGSDCGRCCHRRCGGCCDPCAQPTYVTQKVKCTGYKCVPYTTKVKCRECYLAPVKRKCKVAHYTHRWVVEENPVWVHYCERVPYKTTVRVPVCVPCSTSPCCDAPCQTTCRVRRCCR